MKKDVFLSKIEFDTNGGCWLWSGAKLNSGYGFLYVSKRKKVTTHRFSYQLFKGQIPDGLHVLHSCDVRMCVNPNHLRTGTDQDNVNDMMLRKRECRGSNHPKAKLNDEKVIEIIKLLNEGKLSHQKIADNFEVGRQLISNINSGLKWTHLSHLLTIKYCKFQNCDKIVHSKNLCKDHFGLQHNGKLLCSFNGCNNKAHTKNLCSAHDKHLTRRIRNTFVS